MEKIYKVVEDYETDISYKYYKKVLYDRETGLYIKNLEELKIYFEEKYGDISILKPYLDKYNSDVVTLYLDAIKSDNINVSIGNKFVPQYYADEGFEVRKVMVIPEMALEIYLKELKTLIENINDCLTDISGQIRNNLGILNDTKHIYSNLSSDIIILNKYNSVNREIDITELKNTLVGRIFNNIDEFKNVADIEFYWKSKYVADDGCYFVESEHYFRCIVDNTYKYGGVKIKYLPIPDKKDSFYIVDVYMD